MDILRAVGRWLATRVDMKFAIAAFCLVFIAAIWTTLVVQTQSDRAETIASAIRQNSNLARVFEEHTNRTIKGVDAAALFVAREFARLGTNIDIARYAADGHIDDTLFADVFVINERGDLVVSMRAFSPVNLADREHFKVHVQRDTGKLFINKPLLGRASGKWTIHMSRRITKPDGSFGGIVSMAVDPGYFTDFYRQTDLGKGGLVSLVGLDGISRARLSGPDASFGQDVSKSNLLSEQAKSGIGNYLSAGRNEGVQRYQSYRTIAGYPLVISVGTSKDEVLEGYLQKRKHDFWLALLFTAVIVLFAVLLIAAVARQKRSVAALLGSEAQFRATFNQAAIGICQSALEGRILRTNQKLCQILGYSPEELLTRFLEEITHPDDVAKSAARTRLLLAGEIINTGLEARYLRKDGSVVWVAVSTALVRDARGAPDYFVNMIEGITERKQLQQELLHIAHHDTLTGLPNRALFYDRLAHALDQARRRKWITGVMFIDLDHFKAINDTLGHDIGDQLLQQVSARLTGCVRADDTVGRLGGDEFAVILSELAHEDDARVVAQKIIDALCRPFQVNGNDVSISASIGIASSPPDNADTDTLVRNADTAMYHAKQAGKNNYQFYTPASNERAKEKLALERDLRQALVRNEYVLHFQPKVHLVTGRITGMEALLRWQRPGGALVPPAEFIPLLEKTGLIVPVGEWVLRAACAQISAWRQAGLRLVPIAVNLSAKQFHQQDICETVIRALRDHDVDPKLMEIEITESAAMHNAEQTASALLKLKAIGIRIAIDDFGTGYSSLAYLKRFPIDTLKIDRSFIADLPGNEDDAPIAQAVITMAHALHLKVIAEGVETGAQMEFLAANGCDEMQGYFFSRPLPAPQCTELLRQDRKLPRPASSADERQRTLLLADEE